MSQAKEKEAELFANLSFERFREMAQDTSLSQYEKIGFPDSYREGKEALIFQDLLAKLPALSQQEKVVLDIGPGCSELPQLLIEQTAKNNSQLLLVDSAEMLAHLPDASNVTKYPAFYPDCPSLFSQYTAKVDAIIVYSVIQYIYVESNLWDFLDKSLQLLAQGGQLLIGDIPNVSKRKRFFSSAAGVAFHQAYTGTDEIPVIDFDHVEEGQIDDSVIMAILLRTRLQGFDAYVVPQRADLPMANRREDILITRP